MLTCDIITFVKGSLKSLEKLIFGGSESERNP